MNSNGKSSDFLVRTEEKSEAFEDVKPGRMTGGEFISSRSLDIKGVSG